MFKLLILTFEVKQMICSVKNKCRDIHFIHEDTDRKAQAKGAL